MASELVVKVWRGRESGGFVTYRVPRLESQTVLDVVAHIQRNLDSSLAYRYACRVGMCGSCAMSVNGVARWTCRTHVARVARDGELEIAPLANLPVIRDLATDMSGFFDKCARARGRFSGAATRRDDFARVDPASPARAAADAGIECIGCGLARAGILEIIQGARGGFRLLISPEEVTLLEVVEAVVGEIFLNDCLLKPRSCSRVESCAVHQVWIKATTQLRETLGQASFAQFLSEESCVDPDRGRQRREC